MNNIVQKGVVVFIAFCALSGVGGVILVGLMIYSRAIS
ncbi:Uncharacterised protein [Budvicia aquatica]|uniref:Uncharacterized protein n=1 Tax=Budvicia aquatica TaxID=82979 RepID=A0A484ZH79_9GAMM|nr:Uncharacterised protein [Budvicia aquatica]